MDRAVWWVRRDSGNPDKPGRHTSRHIARYILVGIYTGSRNDDICGAAVILAIGRGYVDIQNGIFKRKPDNKKETSKRHRLFRSHHDCSPHAALEAAWHLQSFGDRMEWQAGTHHQGGLGPVVEKAGLASDDRARAVIRPHRDHVLPAGWGRH